MVHLWIQLRVGNFLKTNHLKDGQMFWITRSRTNSVSHSTTVHIVGNLTYVPTVSIDINGYRGIFIYAHIQAMFYLPTLGHS